MDIEKYSYYFTDDEQLCIELLDKVKRAKKSFKYIQTDFISPDAQEFLKKVCFEEGLFVTFFGGLGDFERAVGIIGTEEYDGSAPIDVIKVSGNFKFENLIHRDFLGAVLSLGIKREKVGDINLYEDGAEVYLHKEISDYVCFNLTKIKNTGVKALKINYNDARERIQQFSEKKINVASLRLDCIVSSAANLSREKASSLIRNGSVKINYCLCDDSSKKLNEGDLVSIRGYGRFYINSLLGITKKDRISLLIKKYI
ncbi:RNA-binding protein YlmH, contains S4-like domain [Caloramator quimbayensis]|uniref:RNA-binding protein YlmH, contains S4-like domain n=1 Tax=Caloramator quimbayensis TaxID=1147123 RepID=A0A1T4X3Y4_9CLOT|nr:YlmH/Sll1252 family protein [Caloramator quimbayensis]SKA83581.1 RNA-binding protein YlmH, contains S4-like domain [Caloramator quimbayensis]